MQSDNKSIADIISEMIINDITSKFSEFKKETLGGIIDLGEDLKNLETQYNLIKNEFGDYQKQTIKEINDLSENITNRYSNNQELIQEQHNKIENLVTEAVGNNSKSITSKVESLTEVTNKLMDSLKSDLNEISNNSAKNTEVIEGQIEKVIIKFENKLNENLKEIEKSIKNLEEFSDYYKKNASEMGDKIDKIEELIKTQEEKYTNLNSSFEEFRQKQESILQIMEELSGKFSRIKSIDMFSKSKTPTKLKVIKSSDIGVFSSPKLEFSPKFKSESSRNATIDCLIQLEKIANQEGITGNEIKKYTQDARDIVFENLLQRGAIMELLKEGIMIFKKNPDNIDTGYIKGFARQLNIYRKVCENAPIDSLE